MEAQTSHQPSGIEKHWLFGANLSLGIFISLPYLAPILMHYGYSAPANAIYQIYRITCHQLPSRSYHIFEHQAGLCHRCSAIWATLFLGGLVFIFMRHKLKAIPFHWWILALIPVGLDGGTQLMGPLYEVFPKWSLTGFAIMVWLIGSALLYKLKVSHWQFYLFLFCFPLGMIYVHGTGIRLSNWQLRTLTGAILGIAYVWLLFPLLQNSFSPTSTSQFEISSPPAG